MEVFYPKNTPKIGRNRQLPAKNKMSNNSETVRDTPNISINHDYETGVALSDSVNKSCVKRLLAEKSRWRHIRLVIKPRYLGNHASQIKSLYRTSSGSHGRSFIIHHENSPEAPLVEKSRWRHIRLVIKSRKPCITYKKLLWNTIRKSGSLF